MRKIVVQLVALFLLFVLTAIAPVIMPFRQAGNLYTLRIVLFAASFALGGAWVLFSCLAMPRAVRALIGLNRAGASPRMFLLPGVALGVSSVPLLLVLATLFSLPGFRTLRMPGQSYQGPAPVLTPLQITLRANLQQHVQRLAGDLGDRNVATEYTHLCLAADYIGNTFSNAGYAVHRQSYTPKCGAARNRTCDNIEVEIRGTVKPAEIILIGAHYDSVAGCPGANDNGSGVAALLELARAWAGHPSERTLRFVAFANEEPPYFWTSDMGSAVYADRCRSRHENVVAMLSLETLGYYSSEPHSQRYPSKLLEWFYPTTGNFVGFVGNTPSRALVRETLAAFRSHASFPSQGAALPSAISGVEWSDNWSFSREHYPAMMVTDTAPFRYSHYHTTHDTPDKLDYDRFAYVVSMLEPVIAGLANPSSVAAVSPGR